MNKFCNKSNKIKKTIKLATILQFTLPLPKQQQQKQHKNKYFLINKPSSDNSSDLQNTTPTLDTLTTGISCCDNKNNKTFIDCDLNYKNMSAIIKQPITNNNNTTNNNNMVSVKHRQHHQHPTKMLNVKSVTSTPTSTSSSSSSSAATSRTSSTATTGETISSSSSGSDPLESDFSEGEMDEINDDIEPLPCDGKITVLHPQQNGIQKDCLLKRDPINKINDNDGDEDDDDNDDEEDEDNDNDENEDNDTNEEIIDDNDYVVVEKEYELNDFQIIKTIGKFYI